MRVLLCAVFLLTLAIPDFGDISAPQPDDIVAPPGSENGSADAAESQAAARQRKVAGMKL